VKYGTGGENIYSLRSYKKCKQNFERTNQNHAYHIIITNTAVNTRKMQPSKYQICRNGITHTMQFNICGSVHHALYWWNTSNKM